MAKALLWILFGFLSNEFLTNKVKSDSFLKVLSLMHVFL